MAPRESQPQIPSTSSSAGPSSSQSLPSFADTFAGFPRPSAPPAPGGSASAGERERSELPPIKVMDPPRLQSNGRKRSHNDDQDSPSSPQVKDEIDELDESASSAPQGKRRRVTVSGSQRPEALQAPAVAPMRPTLPVSDARRGSLPGVGSMRSPAPVPARLPPVPSTHPSLTAHLHPGAAALPATPISFTRRRQGAGARGKKPADILISPRDAAPPPSIMSAPPAVSEHHRPPVPPALFPPPHHQHPPPHSHHQQQSHLHGPATPGMTIPSIPALGAPPPRRAPAAVPPTPGRVSMRGALQTPSASAFNIPERDRSHLAVPTVPISGALHSPRVPPTPGVLRSFSSGPHPGPSSAKPPASREKERDAFLSPFAAFYDTLRDAAELKAFLAASVHKAERAAVSLDDAVERRVEERVRPIRDELDTYKRRVDALEEEMRSLRASSVAPETLRPNEGYQFPAGESRNTQSPEVRGRERERTHEQGSKSPPSEEPRASTGP